MSETLNPGQFKNNVSPNQLAFQGMEKGAHPTAALARKGYTFKMEREREDENGNPIDAYVMTAHHDAIAGEAASLEWAGQHSEMHAHYPGMIEMVNTMPAHQRQGLATALYKHATDTDMGQATRPVHSPTLTAYGKVWSKAVGGPGARGDSASDAPEGYHPFEDNEPEDPDFTRGKRLFRDRRLAKAGQKMLPGMEKL